MQDTFHITHKNREAIVNLSKTLSLDELNTIPKGFNNNILWNMGHMVAVQQLLVYGLSKTPYKVDQWIIDNFKNKSKPEKPYTLAEYDNVVNAMLNTILQMEADYSDKVFGPVTPFISKSLNTTIDTLEGIIKFNSFHEGLHTGVIQKYVQLIK